MIIGCEFRPEFRQRNRPKRVTSHKSRYETFSESDVSEKDETKPKPKKKNKVKAKKPRTERWGGKSFMQYCTDEGIESIDVGYGLKVIMLKGDNANICGFCNRFRELRKTKETPNEKV